ncbi:MAG: pitrilysin family protein [Gemmatimonadota bacterium]
MTEDWLTDAPTLRPAVARRRRYGGTAVRAVLLLFLLAVPPFRLAAQQLRVPYSTFTLPNGLRVILHEDHSVPVVTVNTWYHVGSGDERPGRTGFAHLFEHVMFMGSQHVPTGDFDRLLEAAGADNNGSTTEDRTNYYEDGPAGALPLMLFLDADRMGFLLPEIDSAKTDLQRRVVQNERRQSYENQPYGLSEENILRRLYPEAHPYHWPVIGSMADLSAATLEDVRNFFRTYYTPNNATISIAGDISPRAARRLVEQYFGEVQRGPAVTRPDVPSFTLPADVYATLEDRVQLPRVYNAWHSVRAFAQDDAALNALGDVLASGKSSRLYRRLVYELQIANQVAAFQDAGRLDGKFEIVATARPGHDLNEIQRVIDEEIRRIAETGPTQRELERVQNSDEAQFLDGMERVGGFSGKANQLNFYNYFVGTPDYFQRDLERYLRLVPADLQRVARQYLTQAHRVVLSVVPQGATNLAATEGVTP